MAAAVGHGGPRWATVALGVGVIVEHFVVLFATITIVGALYLVFRGTQAIRHRTDPPAETAQSRRPRNPGRMIAPWFVVAVSNLKTIVFLVAVLPQLVEYSRVNIPLPLAILDAVFVVIALLSDNVLALVAGSARAWFTRSPHRVGRLGATGGVMMIGLAPSFCSSAAVRSRSASTGSVGTVLNRTPIAPPRSPRAGCLRAAAARPPADANTTRASR